MADGVLVQYNWERKFFKEIRWGQFIVDEAHNFRRVNNAGLRVLHMLPCNYTGWDTGTIIVSSLMWSKMTLPSLPDDIYDEILRSLYSVEEYNAREDEHVDVLTDPSCPFSIHGHQTLSARRSSPTDLLYDYDDFQEPTSRCPLLSRILQTACTTIQWSAAVTTTIVHAVTRLAHIHRTLLPTLFSVSKSEDERSLSGLKIVFQDTSSRYCPDLKSGSICQTAKFPRVVSRTDARNQGPSTQKYCHWPKGGNRFHDHRVEVIPPSHQVFLTCLDAVIDNKTSLAIANNSFWISRLMLIQQPTEVSQRSIEQTRARASISK